MRDEDVDLCGAVLLEGLGGRGDGAARVNHVVEQDADLVLDVADEDLAALRRVLQLGILGTVDQGKLDAELVRNRRDTAGTMSPRCKRFARLTVSRRQHRG